MIRKQNESYEAFCIRRKLENRRVKDYLKGVVIWPSNIAGTVTHKQLQKSSREQVDHNTN